MIEFVDTVGRKGSAQDTALICTDSIFLQDFIIERLKRRLMVHKDYVIRVSSTGDLKQARGNALAAPIEGKRWLVIIDMNKVSFEAYKKEARRVNDNSFTLLICSKYGVFNKIRKDKDLGQQNFMLSFYFGSFAKDDITYISAGYNITPEIASFLEKNYRWDVNKVMTLFHMIAQGTKVEDKRDVIDLIGNGGVTPASLMIELLTSTPDTKRKQQNTRKFILTCLNDLGRKTPYHTIYQQMYNTLLGILDIKMLKINGDYMGVYKDIPEGYDSKRITRLKRYMWLIESIPLQRVLYMLSLFKNTKSKYGKYAEVECLSIIFEYLGNWSV